MADTVHTSIFRIDEGNTRIHQPWITPLQAAAAAVGVSGEGSVLEDSLLLFDEELHHLLLQVGLVYVVRVHTIPEHTDSG